MSLISENTNSHKGRSKKIKLITIGAISKNVSHGKNGFCWLLLLIPILLFGCKRELYSDLDEVDATEMNAVLLHNGIESDKIRGKEGKWGLTVDKADIPEAFSVLRSAGLPRDHYLSMGEIFKKQGLVSSPLEERARYIYGITQELSNTISKIDGVLSARVHIVQPQNDPLSDSIMPSSASVFIKTTPEAEEIQTRIAQIKELVINSVEGLTIDRVSVAIFAIHGVVPYSGPGYDKIFGFRVRSDIVSSVLGIFFTAVIIFSLLYIFFLWKKTKNRGSGYILGLITNWRSFLESAKTRWSTASKGQKR